ncbi:nucleotidyltransferase domain-containing protein [Chloroflexota bacterium]
MSTGKMQIDDKKFHQIMQFKYFANQLLSLYIIGIPSNKLKGVFNYQIDSQSFFSSSIYRHFASFINDNDIISGREWDYTKKSIEEFLVRLFKVEEEIFSEKHGYAKEITYSVEDNSIFNVDALKYNLENSNRFLNNIIELLHKNKVLLNLVVMDGSLGTNDYKPGWSDIDLFCNLSKEALLSVENLQKTREMIRKVNLEIYKYNILQLHGVFLSTEIDFLFYSNILFPYVPCFEYGSVVYSQKKNYTVHSVQNKDDAEAYFFEIYESATNLLKKLQNQSLSLREGILLFHRIYSFPFAFLQCLQVYKYKKYSFEYLIENYSHLFPESRKFYHEINHYYLDWKISSLRTITLRDLLLQRFHPALINSIFVLFEKDIRGNIKSMFGQLTDSHRVQFQMYLENAKTYLNLPSQNINKANLK